MPQGNFERGPMKQSSPMGTPDDREEIVRLLSADPIAAGTRIVRDRGAFRRRKRTDGRLAAKPQAGAEARKPAAAPGRNRPALPSKRTVQ